MKPERLSKISMLLSGRLFPKDAGNVYVRGVSNDSRTIKAGELFFALKALRDGHDFVKDAFDNGAAAAIVERQISTKLPQIVVDDTLDSLGEFGRIYRNRINPNVVAITGSVGKTTAREIIASVLRAKFKTVSAKNNYNNLIGLPLTLLDMPDDCEFAVVELGINMPGEMIRLSEISQPNAAVITSVARVHTERLDNINRILHEKLKITFAMDPEAPLFLNTDFPKLSNVRNSVDHPIITYGINSGDYRAVDLNFEDCKPDFKVKGYPFKLNMLGYQSVYACLAAIAVGDYFDIPIPKIQEVLEVQEALPHRMQLVKLNGIKIIDDSYNACPISVKEALNCLNKISGNRKIAVLGDMLELGTHEEKSHEDIGVWLYENDVDMVILYGDRMNFASEKLRQLKFTGELVYTKDFAVAKHKLINYIQSDDVILIKGSNKMGMSKFIDAIRDIMINKTLER